MAQQLKTVEIKFLAEFKELFNEEWRNIVFYGGRGSGKSQHVALALILRGRQKRLRILCTREIQNTIKDSVHKLLSDIITQYGLSDYEVTDKTIRNRLTGTEFLFSGLRHNVNEIKSMEGVDVCWCEEAQSLSESSLQVLAPTIRKPGSQLIFTFNRFTELDPVYVRYVMRRPDKTYVRQVNYDVLDRAGLLPDSLRLEMEADRADADTFAHVWLGEPLSQADNAILGRDKVLAAMQREVQPLGAIEIASDVARMGDDRTVMRKRRGLRSTESRVYTKLRTTEVCDKLEDFAGATGLTPDELDQLQMDVLFKIDDSGVGGGVTDELIRRGWRVIPLIYQAVPQLPDKYPNLISEAWFYLDSIIDTIQLDMDSELLMELSNRLWKQDSKGRRVVESKDDYKKRGYRSPDKADATVMVFYNTMLNFAVPDEHEDGEDDWDMDTADLLDHEF